MRQRSFALPGIVRREDDGEVRRHFQKFRHHLHTAIGNIRDVQSRGNDPAPK